jgi:hypothetical protein
MSRYLKIKRSDDAAVASEAKQDLAIAVSEAVSDGIGGASATTAGDTGASTTNGFLRWIRDKLYTIAPSTWMVVGGAAAVGESPTANPVGVSGVDGGGLKRPLLTDATGKLTTVTPDCADVSGSASSAGVLFTVDMLNYQSICVNVTSAGGSNTIVWEVSADGLTNWISVSGAVIAPTATAAGVLSSLSSANSMIFGKRLRYFRARVSVYGSGTVSVAGNLLNAAVTTSLVALCVGTAGEGVAATGLPVTIGIEARTNNKTSVVNGGVVRPIATVDGRTVMRPNSIPENEWYYAAASGGIVNTTTETQAKAGVAGHRNYMTTIQLQAEPLTNATEFVIRDGFGGTALWRIKIPTTGLPLTNFKFDDPLRTTVAASFQIQTVTASGTGAVYFNAQGYYAP